MDIAQTGLHHQPFHTGGDPVFFVPYRSQLAAYHFLQTILKDDRGVGLFYGPASAGKMCVVRELRRDMAADIPVAVVDAARSKTLDLLRAIMTQFDPGPSFESIDDHWYALKIFLAEKTRTGRTPLLILKNIDRMYPSSLYALNKLAELQMEGRYLIRIILISNKAPFAIVHSQSMSAIAKRSISAFEMGPMTCNEASTYVYAKLRASGCDDPNRLFPADIVDELHAASDGWPGKLDELATQAIERAKRWPITREHLSAPAAETEPEPPVLTPVSEPVEHPEIQKLFLTFNRKTLREINLTEPKVLIGRSEICDISIESRFVSKHHALLVRTDDALHLLDLNSTNGTFVNSERIINKVLRHDDVISVGNHGIKLICPAYRTRPVVAEADLTETSVMKTLTDMLESKSGASEETAPVEASEG